MPRYKLSIAYDGTDFHGWQFQHQPDPASDPALGADRPRVSLRTVQEELQRAVREIVREPVHVQGSSRTDAGVHARGQIAAFTCSGDDEGLSSDDSTAREPSGTPIVPGGKRGDGGWPVARGVDRLVRAINGRLPDDILVLGAEPVPLGFSPIGDTVAKCYSYTIHASKARALFDRHYVLRVWEPLDLQAMQEAAALLVGEHDFAGFAAAGHGRLSTIRTIFSCTVSRVSTLGARAPSVIESARAMGILLQDAEPTDGTGHVPLPYTASLSADRIVIEVTGSGFLWNMVRIIAGTLADIGRGRKKPEDIIRVLSTGDRTFAGATFPPMGLCLEWIKYAP